MPTPYYYHSPEQKACAHKCRTSGHGRVFFQHMRKAGGTTMRRWMQHEKCMKADSFEGVVQERKPFNITLFREPGMLYMTALRHPVNRIVSAYFFEGRWKQKDHRRRSEDAVSMKDWFKHVSGERRRGTQLSLWMDVENYYVQMMSGRRHREQIRLNPAIPMEAEVAAEWENDFHDAVNVMLSFDLVIVTEWLHEPGQCSWFKKVLDMETDMHAFNTQHMKGDYNTNDYDGVLLADDMQLLFEVHKLALPP